MASEKPPQDATTGAVVGGVKISSATREGTLSQDLFNIVSSSRFVEQISEIAKRPQVMDKAMLERFDQFFNSPDTNLFAQFYYSESPVRVVDSGVSAGHSFVLLDTRYFNAADAQEVVTYLGGAPADVRLAESKDFGTGKLPGDVIALRVPDTIFRDELITPLFLQNGERLADRYPELAKLANEGFTPAGFLAAHKRLAADGLLLGAVANEEYEGFTVNRISPTNGASVARDNGIVLLRNGGKGPQHGEQAYPTQNGTFSINSENVRLMEEKGVFREDGTEFKLSPQEIAGIREQFDRSAGSAAIPHGRPPVADKDGAAR